VLGAACTARRARLAGGLLFAALLAAFVWAGIRIDNHATFQRPDWRGVAAALGVSGGPRAIVAYDGTFATAPLAQYLPGVAWTGSGQNPQPTTGASQVRVEEVDVVGNIGEQVAPRLPAGVRLIGAQTVDGQYVVARFGLARPIVRTRTAIGGLSSALLGPGSPGPAVLVQRPVPAR
jgi:hypothetical protein